MQITHFICFVLLIYATELLITDKSGELTRNDEMEAPQTGTWQAES